MAIDTTQLTMLVLAGVCLLGYLYKRRARLSRED